MKGRGPGAFPCGRCAPPGWHYICLEPRWARESFSLPPLDEDRKRPAVAGWRGPVGPGRLVPWCAVTRLSYMPAGFLCRKGFCLCVLCCDEFVSPSRSSQFLVPLCLVHGKGLGHLGLGLNDYPCFHGSRWKTSATFIVLSF